MNRIILLIVTGGVLFAAIIGLTDLPQRQLTLVDLLPQETIAVIESKNAALACKQWQSGLLGRTLSHPDLSAFAGTFDLTTIQGGKLTTIATTFNQVAHNFSSASLFARESIIALLPARFGEPIELTKLQSHLVLLQHTAPGEDVRQLFSRCFGTITSTNWTEFQGQILTRLTFDQGTSLTYFTHEGILVWAFDEQVLHSCVNQLLQQLVPIRAGLQKHAAYSRLKKHAGRSVDTFAYMRVSALHSLFGCERNSTELGKWPCPDDLAVFTTPVPKGQRLVVVALTDADTISAFKRRNHLSDAVENTPLGRLSSNTSCALWTNWFQPNRLWERFQQSDLSPLKTLVTGWSQDLAKAGGVSLAKFFTLFGSEFSLHIEQLRAPHQYPRSMASVVFEVHDSDQVGRFLQQVASGLQAVEVLSGGIKIVTLILADGLLQPAYSLVNHHLVLADSVELIERIQERLTLPEIRISPNRGFQSQRSNFFLFLRTGDMVEWLLPVLTTIGKEFGGNSRDDVHQGFFLQPLVLSTLVELRQIETSRIRAYLEKDEMFLEVIYSPIQRYQPRTLP